MFQDVHLHNEKHALFSNAEKALRPVYTCDFSVFWLSVPRQKPGIM